MPVCNVSTGQTRAHTAGELAAIEAARTAEAAAYVATEPNGFDRFTPRELLEALLTEMVTAGVNGLTVAKAQAIAVGVRNRLKR